MRILLQGRMRAPIATLCALMLVSGSLQAHNKPVHQDLVDQAYEMMMAVEKGSVTVPRPSNVSDAEWQAFLAALTVAPGKFRERPSDLPAPKLPACFAPVNDKGNDPGLGWSQTNMGNVKLPVSSDYAIGMDCGVRYGWVPGGLFNTTNPADANLKRDWTGNVLGFWAASVDDEFDDTHLWIRPTTAGGIGAVNDFVDDATDYGLAVLLAPIVCIAELFAGNPGACLSDSVNIADKANPIDDLEGMIPGVGNISGADFVGMWHHIKVMGPATNEFDNHQGYQLEASGPTPLMDPLDMVMMAAADATGLSVHYNASLGPKRYEVVQGNDFHPDTSVRTFGKWQHGTVAHTPFEPVDNLALFGWKNYRDGINHSVKFLGWTLHALGDATVPMHTAGTAAWGHRPFEDAQEQLWPQLTQRDAATSLNKRRVEVVLTKAFQWRKFILDWRAAHPGQNADIPVRDMVTELAKKTAAASPVNATWPFNSGASTTYLITKDAATAIYANRSDAVTLYQPMLEEGIAATVAFLMSAAEVLP